MEIKEKHYQFVCQQTTDISTCLTFTFTFPLWIYRSDQMTQVQNYSRLKNDTIHQKYDVSKNTHVIVKALEHLQKAFWNDLSEFACS